MSNNNTCASRDLQQQQQRQAVVVVRDCYKYQPTQTSFTTNMSADSQRSVNKLRPANRKLYTRDGRKLLARSAAATARDHCSVTSQQPALNKEISAKKLLLVQSKTATQLPVQQSVIKKSSGRDHRHGKKSTLLTRRRQHCQQSTMSTLSRKLLHRATHRQHKQDDVTRRNDVTQCAQELLTYKLSNQQEAPPTSLTPPIPAQTPMTYGRYGRRDVINPAAGSSIDGNIFDRFGFNSCNKSIMTSQVTPTVTSVMTSVVSSQAASLQATPRETAATTTTESRDTTTTTSTSVIDVIDVTSDTVVYCSAAVPRPTDDVETSVMEESVPNIAHSPHDVTHDQEQLTSCDETECYSDVVVDDVVVAGISQEMAQFLSQFQLCETASLKQQQQQQQQQSTADELLQQQRQKLLYHWHQQQQQQQEVDQSTNNESESVSRVQTNDSPAVDSRSRDPEVRRCSSRIKYTNYVENRFQISFSHWNQVKHRAKRNKKTKDKINMFSQQNAAKEQIANSSSEKTWKIQKKLIIADQSLADSKPGSDKLMLRSRIQGSSRSSKSRDTSCEEVTKSRTRDRLRSKQHLKVSSRSLEADEQEHVQEEQIQEPEIKHRKKQQNSKRKSETKGNKGLYDAVKSDIETLMSRDVRDNNSNDDESAEALIRLTNKLNEAAVSRDSQQQQQQVSRRRNWNKHQQETQSSTESRQDILALELGPRFNWLENKIHTMQSKQTTQPVDSFSTLDCSPTGCHNTGSTSSNTGDMTGSSDGGTIGVGSTSGLTSVTKCKRKAFRKATISSSRNKCTTGDTATTTGDTTTGELGSTSCLNAASVADLTTMTSLSTTTAAAATVDNLLLEQLSQVADHNQCLELTNDNTQAKPTTAQDKSRHQGLPTSVSNHNSVGNYSPKAEPTTASSDEPMCLVTEAAILCGIIDSDDTKTLAQQQQQQQQQDDSVINSEFSAVNVLQGSQMLTNKEHLLLNTNNTLKQEYSRRYQLYRTLCNQSVNKDNEIALLEAERDRLRKELLYMEKCLRANKMTSSPSPVPQLSTTPVVVAPVPPTGVAGDRTVNVVRVIKDAVDVKLAHSNMTTVNIVVCNSHQPPQAHCMKLDLTMYTSLFCTYKHTPGTQSPVIIYTPQSPGTQFTRHNLLTDADKTLYNVVKCETSLTPTSALFTSQQSSACMMSRDTPPHSGTAPDVYKDHTRTPDQPPVVPPDKLPVVDQLLPVVTTDFKPGQRPQLTHQRQQCSSKVDKSRTVYVQPIRSQSASQQQQQQQQQHSKGNSQLTSHIPRSSEPSVRPGLPDLVSDTQPVDSIQSETPAYCDVTNADMTSAAGGDMERRALEQLQQFVESRPNSKNSQGPDTEAGVEGFSGELEPMCSTQSTVYCPSEQTEPTHQLIDYTTDAEHTDSKQCHPRDQHTDKHQQPTTSELNERFKHSTQSNVASQQLVSSAKQHGTAQYHRPPPPSYPGPPGRLLPHSDAHSLHNTRHIGPTRLPGPPTGPPSRPVAPAVRGPHSVKQAPSRSQKGPHTGLSHGPHSVRGSPSHHDNYQQPTGYRQKCPGPTFQLQSTTCLPVPSAGPPVTGPQHNTNTSYQPTVLTQQPATQYVQQQQQQQQQQLAIHHVTRPTTLTHRTQQQVWPQTPSHRLFSTEQQEADPRSHTDLYVEERFPGLHRAPTEMTQPYSDVVPTYSIQPQGLDEQTPSEQYRQRLEHSQFVDLTHHRQQQQQQQQQDEFVADSQRLVWSPQTAHHQQQQQQQQASYCRPANNITLTTVQQPSTQLTGDTVLDSNCRCETCGRPASFVCSACKVVPYCSHDCQAKSWRLNHSSVCNTRQ